MKVKKEKGPALLPGAPVNTVVLPGDVIGDVPSAEAAADEDGRPPATLFMGPGLRQDRNRVVVTKPGMLKYKAPNKYWVDSAQKRVCVLLYASGLD